MYRIIIKVKTEGQTIYRKPCLKVTKLKFYLFLGQLLLFYSYIKKPFSPFLSNGALDPWSAGGVTQNITDSLVAVLIEDGAHHLDLRHKNPLDPPSVVQARNIEKRYIAQWIKEYNDRRKDQKHFRISSKRKFKNISILQLNSISISLGSEIVELSSEVLYPVYKTFFQRILFAYVLRLLDSELKDKIKNLRLLPTFAGSLQEKIRTCAGFNKIPTNYISKESLINGVYD